MELRLRLCCWWQKARQDKSHLRSKMGEFSHHWVQPYQFHGWYENFQPRQNKFTSTFGDFIGIKRENGKRRYLIYRIYAPTFLQHANLHGCEIYSLLEEYRVEVESISRMNICIFLLTRCRSHMTMRSTHGENNNTYIPCIRWLLEGRSMKQ